MTLHKLDTEIDKTKEDIKNFTAEYENENSAGSYDNWNARDVTAHILEWIMFSKNKLYAISHKRPFSEVTDIDRFNRENHSKHKNTDMRKAERDTLQSLDEYKRVVSLYTQDDLHRKDLPTGFSFELWRYMIMDTVIHPVLHLLYYMIKTKHYDSFIKLCRDRKSIFSEYSNGKMSVYSFGEYIEDRQIFTENMLECKRTHNTNDTVDLILRENGTGTRI